MDLPVQEGRAVEIDQLSITEVESNENLSNNDNKLSQEISEVPKCKKNERGIIESDNSVGNSARRRPSDEERRCFADVIAYILQNICLKICSLEQVVEYFIKLFMSESTDFFDPGIDDDKKILLKEVFSSAARQLNFNFDEKMRSIFRRYIII